MQDLEAYIRERLKHNHFTAHMGIELVSLLTDHAVIKLQKQEFHLQQNGFLHGGVTATLCDVATGIAAYTRAMDGKNVVTADLKVSYLNPSVSNHIKATGRVVKAGRFLAFCEGQVFDILPEGEILVATCSSIMCFVDIPVT